MKFDVGYYKVQKEKGYSGTSNHYVRVFMKDHVKYIQVDHQPPQEAERCEEQMTEQYTIVKRISKPVEFNRIRVAVTWEDEDGDNFEFETRNSAVLESIFQAFPRLKKAFDP